MRKVLIVVAALLVAPELVAQTTTHKVLWDYLNTTPATVGTYQQVLTINGIAAPGTPVCVAAGADTACELTVAGPAPTGAATYVITATLNGISRSASRTISPTTGPTQPGAPRIQVTVVVTS
ncbi:MAG: hypothetical protein WBC33_07840 [Conexibacter sp.]